MPATKPKQMSLSLSNCAAILGPAKIPNLGVIQACSVGVAVIPRTSFRESAATESIDGQVNEKTFAKVVACGWAEFYLHSPIVNESCIYT